MKKVDLKNFSVSVIIPCFNEEGNIEECIKRVPKMGKFTEIVVVDDGSTDDTAKIVKHFQKRNKNLRLISYSPNKGKGYAINKAMNGAKGDILAILDADMAVIPEDLPKFIEPLMKGEVGFTNGTRFKKNMQKGAMKKLNLIGNKMMGQLFKYAIRQEITDSLCGTKALFKKDFKKMGGIDPADPWSDFSLIFGAAKLGLKIKEIPISYKRRVAGKSKMKLFSHGTKLMFVWFKQYQNYNRHGLS